MVGLVIEKVIIFSDTDGTIYVDSGSESNNDGDSDGNGNSDSYSDSDSIAWP